MPSRAIAIEATRSAAISRLNPRSARGVRKNRAAVTPSDVQSAALKQMTMTKVAESATTSWSEVPLDAVVSVARPLRTMIHAFGLTHWNAAA